MWGSLLVVVDVVAPFSRSRASCYAQHLILVNFLLVNFFTKMNIARNPGGVQVPGSLQMNPTGPPELFQPSRDLNNSQKVD